MYEFDSTGLGTAFQAARVMSRPLTLAQQAERQLESGTAASEAITWTIDTPIGPKKRVGMHIVGPSGLRHTCHCYEDLPRDMVAAVSRPYALEFATGLFGKRYECGCEPVWTWCPESMRPIPAAPDFATKKRLCEEYQQRSKKRLPEAYKDIEDEGFRLAIAQHLGRAAGLTEAQVERLDPAEFLTVAEEKSRRATGIWILSAITVAAGGGYLLWSFLRGRKRTEP
jgi:hypothetical protein